ncbi:MAG: pitrilysin family protein [Desulfobacterales bacterium]|nr:pitrilysin family protein [Desulfobacterales bacterium]
MKIPGFCTLPAGLKKSPAKRRPPILSFLFLWAVYLTLSSAPEIYALENTAGTSKVLFKTLDNGMTVAVRENHALPLVAVYAFIKNTGGINEGAYLGSGISHFLEHLVSNGRTTKQAGSGPGVISGFRVPESAYTSNNLTSFHMTVLPRRFNAAVDLISGWIMNCALDPGEFANEKKVALKEIDMDEEDPDTVLYNAFMEQMFRVHYRRYPVLGYRENLEKLTRQDLLNFYREKYTPDNVVFVVVGDIAAEEAFSKIKDAFKNFKRRPAIHTPIPDEPPQVSMRYFEKSMPVEVARIIMGYHTVGLLHEDVYPLDILAYILGQGRSARLLKEIVYRQKLATDVSVYSETPFNGAGSFVMTADLAEGTAAEKGTEALIAVLEEVKKDPVAAEELARAKARKISDFIYSNQDVQDQAEVMGEDIIGTGDPEFSRRYVKKIQEVTREDIHRVARRYFHRDNLTVGVLRSSETATVPGTLKNPAPGRLKTEMIKIDNGIRLLVQENRTHPSVAIRAYFQGGLRFSTREKAGIFPLLSNMLLRGTKNRSAENLAAEIEDLGGKISVTSGDDSFGINLDLVSGSEEKGIKILADIILQPAFSPEELDNERSILKEKIKRREDNWVSEVYDFLRAEFFQKHPYGFPPEGTVDTVDKLSLADLRDTYAQFCIAGNLVIAVFGDIDSKKVARIITEAFSAMAAKDFRVKPPARESPPVENRRFSKAVKKKQVAFSLGYKGADITSPDRYSLDVISALVSGKSAHGGWLYTALRGGKMSYVYYIQAKNQVEVDPGFFYVITQFSPEHKDRVTEIISGVFNRLRSADIKGEELEAAKEICITEHRIKFQSNGNRANRDLHNELYGQGFDFDKTYEESILKVSAGDIQKAVKKYFTGPQIEVWTHPEVQ